MVLHAHEVWAEECAERGEEGVQATVRMGVERSRPYGLVAEYDVGRYIDLMFAFCDDFDESPRTPWARAILKDGSLSPRERMDALWARAEHELERRAAEDEEYVY